MTTNAVGDARKVPTEGLRSKRRRYGGFVRVIEDLQLMRRRGLEEAILAAIVESS